MKDVVLNDYLARYYRGDNIRELFEELWEEAYFKGYVDAEKYMDMAEGY